MAASAKSNVYPELNELVTMTVNYLSTVLEGVEVLCSNSSIQHSYLKSLEDLSSQLRVSRILGHVISVIYR
jgi:hypothetical protein